MTDAGGASDRLVDPALDVVWLGHASTDITIDGARLVTDPVLRDKVAHLRRHDGASTLAPGPIGAVLISHLHHDHLDLRSVRQLPKDTPLIVPRGAARLLARHAPGDIVEVRPGDEVVVDGVRVTAIPAEHKRGRTGRRAEGDPLGFLMESASHVVYFPGDTDLHPIMADLPAPDLALLPIWGWGRTLGPGHLDPDRAAQAAAVLRARAVVPVHWGTFAPVRLGSGAPLWLRQPADQFRAAMERHAPETDLRIVRPGGTSAMSKRRQVDDTASGAVREFEP
jgi:L-ascorbate metabolism protein UlaG (beta-lactamase superfamily)